jgi:ribonuclease VapC
MIVVDTSALMAILNKEAAALDCRRALRRESAIAISAGTYTEAMIVAAGRGMAGPMDELLRRTISDVITLTPERARLAAQAYTVWGKGNHSAALNFGDCFAYAVARELNCPLLFVGNDFSKTDIVSALPPQQD